MDFNNNTPPPASQDDEILALWPKYQRTPMRTIMQFEEYACLLGVLLNDAGIDSRNQTWRRLRTPEAKTLLEKVAEKLGLTYDQARSAAFGFDSCLESYEGRYRQTCDMFNQAWFAWGRRIGRKLFGAEAC